MFDTGTLRLGAYLFFLRVRKKNLNFGLTPLRIIAQCHSTNKEKFPRANPIEALSNYLNLIHPTGYTLNLL